MIVLVSLIVLLRGFPCLHDFSHGASNLIHSFLHLFHIFLYGSRRNVATLMHAESLTRTRWASITCLFSKMASK